MHFSCDTRWPSGCRMANSPCARMGLAINPTIIIPWPGELNTRYTHSHSRQLASNKRWFCIFVTHCLLFCSMGTAISTKVLCGHFYLEEKITLSILPTALLSRLKNASGRSDGQWHSRTEEGINNDLLIQKWFPIGTILYANGICHSRADDNDCGNW